MLSPIVLAAFSFMHKHAWAPVMIAFELARLIELHVPSLYVPAVRPIIKHGSDGM